MYLKELRDLARLMDNHGKGQMESYLVTLEMTFRVFYEVKYLILYSIEAKTEHTLRTRLSQRHHHYSSVHSCWSISLI